METMLYNRLQARVLSELINDPEKLGTLHTITEGKTKEYFNGPYLPFYLALQWLSDSKKEITLDSVEGVVRKSKLGKQWEAGIKKIADDTIERLNLPERYKEFIKSDVNKSCIDIIKKDIETAEPVTNFGALVGKMVANNKGVKKPLPQLPIKRSVLSKKQILYLEKITRDLGRAKWWEVKQHLGIDTPGIDGLSRVQCSAIIDYVKEEGLIK